MDSDWAQQRLDVIRTLMERSAIYRRALAPIMFLLGLLGMTAGIIGYFSALNDPLRFTLFWMSISIIALAGAFLLIRRQSIQEREPFWSPPTRRVAQALVPALFAGAALGVTAALEKNTASLAALLVPLWMFFYGCAVHAAGFFMPRGFKLFGWLFILAASGLLFSLLRAGGDLPREYAHLLMAAFFGGFHFAYGVYLYFTEKKNAA